MKHVEIIHRSGLIILIDLEDLSLYNNQSWTINKDGYVYSTTPPYQFLHRVVLGYFDELQVDHISQNKLDNRKCNLRICSQTENSMNQPKKFGHTVMQSKYKGVHWPKGKGKWRASITFNKKRYYLGWFYSEIDAAKAYDKKAIELCKEFAELNFPNERY